MGSKRPLSAKERDLKDISAVMRAISGGGDNFEPLDYLSSDLKVFQHEFKFSIDGLVPLASIPGDVVLKGGGGIVFQCHNRDIPELAYALKVPRPSLLKGQFGTVQGELVRATEEYYKHAPLSHTNVAKVFGAGAISIAYGKRKYVRLELTPILMEWIAGAKPLVRFLLENVKHWRDCLPLVQQVFLGLAHLHSRNLVHWDMKSDNVLVDYTGCPKIVDIGNARRLDVVNRGAPFSTRQNLPPPLLGPSPPGTEVHLESSRHTRVKLPNRQWEKPWIDLWMTAREFNRVFHACPVVLGLDRPSPSSNHSPQDPGTAFVERVFPSDDPDASLARDSIRLILRRLLAKDSPDAHAYYNKGEEVAADLEKLMTEFGAAQAIEELHAIPQKVIRLPATGNAPFSHRISPIYNSSLVQRVTRHLQLGTLIQVYPGAGHRRSEHLVGALAAAMQYVRALYSNRSEPFWRLAVERSDVDALILAALLHDIGHMAFGHTIEEMAGLLRGFTHEDYAHELLNLGPWEQGSLTTSGDRQELRSLLGKHWGLSADETEVLLKAAAAILKPPPAPVTLTHLREKDPLLDPTCSRWLKVRLLHSIIDSAIDADKLDYLLRDAHHCGVEYAKGVDVERFFQSLSPVLVRERHDVPSSIKDALVGVSEKGTLPVESILVARYQMFSSVYWHHTARAQATMLQYAVQEYVGTGETSAETRLFDLCQRFRTEHDAQALTWLRAQLADFEESERKALIDICDGLGGMRGKLYWPAFELRYEPSGGTPAAVSEHFWNVARELNEAPTPGEYLRRAKNLRQTVGERLSDRLDSAVCFAPGEILVDLPPPQQDQITNVWVMAGGRARPIHELSPLADAVRNAFRFWVRRLRIFLSPDAWQRLERAGISPDRVHAASWNALVSISEEMNAQQTLDLAPSTSRSPRPPSR